MFKFAQSLIFLCALFLSTASSAQSLFDCDLLIGTWVGEHTYENGQYSRWEAVYAEDGVFSIEFFATEDGEAVGGQLGSWQCDGLWVTSSAEENGEQYSFSYEIKALDSFRYLYESSQGPLFTSYRKQGAAN